VDYRNRFRLVDVPVSTAGGSEIRSIREGYLGNVFVMGMGDELQVQLLSLHSLTEMGYEFTANRHGAVITRQSFRLVIPWVDNLLTFDLRNIQEFREPYRPVDSTIEPTATLTIG